MMDSQSHSTARLSLFISRPHTPPPPEEEDDPLPPTHTAVSVPFKWEEAPGKPRKSHTESEPKINNNDSGNNSRTLELPPRLLFLEACNNKVSSMEVVVDSPTTVLGGPYVGRAMSFTSSYRTPREYRVSNFGSARWSSSRKITEDDPEGNLDFSPAPMVRPHLKIGRNPRSRRQSSLSLSNQSKGSSHFWASIYENFKQMVPWRRRQQQQHRK